MSKRNNRPSKGNLAVALAAGRTAAAWARETGTAERTARRWAREDDVVHQVEAIRRRAVDRAIGLLTRHATTAARELARLASDKDTPAGARVAAARAVLQELLNVKEHQDLVDRVNELERRTFV
jgi:hypothetical protein